MNRKIFTYSLFCVFSALVLSACDREDIAVPGGENDDDYIIFHTSLPGVETRSYDNIQIGNLQGGFTVAAHNLEQEPEANGKLPFFFEKVFVKRTEGMGDAFRGDGCKWPDNKDGKDGRLRFYAFYPSIETMLDKSGYYDTDKEDWDSPKDYFLLHDNTTKSGSTISYNYRVGHFKVNRDISRHMDFVAATVFGTKTDNLYSGVNLEFEHKLSRIDFKAWSASPSYKVEIAGVRIGCAIVCSTYNMEGNWIYGNPSFNSTTGKYSGTEKKTVEYIFRDGDTVVTLDGISYNTSAKATSIMGNGGWAMIIPGNQNNAAGKYTIWAPKTNANNSNKGVYFSVLMRVIDKTDDQGLILYPYVDGATITGTTTASNKHAVYLVVEKTSGKVKSRVYKKGTAYYTDKACTKVYSRSADDEVRTYGWAAIPSGPDVNKNGWEKGKTYTYVLDYTSGIGVHAPDDDAPGKDIITSLSVGVSEEGGDWEMVKNYEEVELKEKEDFTYIQE